MARVRSPAYPALSLSAAVDMIGKVHKAQQRTPEPRSVVVQHMGYSRESGRSDKSISALIKYGFLERAGKEGLRVTDRAVSILYPDPEDQGRKENELKLAAQAPDLFKEIFDRWDHRPSEASLKAFLIQKGFNVNSVDQVARAFYETYDLVSGLGDSYDSVESDIAEASEERGQEMEHMDVGNGNHGESQTPPPALLNVTKPVFDFDTVQINTQIDNQEDLDELISRLEKIKAMLPTKDEN